VEKLRTQPKVVSGETSEPSETRRNSKARGADESEAGKVWEVSSEVADWSSVEAARVRMSKG
jgi:hypothetical protein